MPTFTDREIKCFLFPVLSLQAKKRKDSPHGKDTIRTPEGSVSEIEGIEFKNKLAVNPGSKKVSLGPYY